MRPDDRAEPSAAGRLFRVAPAPEPTLPRRTLVEELLVVLSLSLLASAAFAILSFTAAPVNATRQVATIPQTARLDEQLVPIAFALAPVWLVSYLVRRNREGASAIGMAFDRPRFDVGAAVILALVVGAAGIVIYVVSVRIGHNRIVVP